MFVLRRRLKLTAGYGGSKLVMRTWCIFCFTTCSSTLSWTSSHANASSSSLHVCHMLLKVVKPEALIHLSIHAQRNMQRHTMSLRSSCIIACHQKNNCLQGHWPAYSPFVEESCVSTVDLQTSAFYEQTLVCKP